MNASANYIRNVTIEVIIVLDDRKLKVLYAIINSYVDSAEPIGSRTISKKYDLGVSSATIRNEMSDLEDLGYLSKPHSSAGRVPSDKGYRLYVNELLKLKASGNEDINLNQKFMESLIKEANELDELIENAAKMLSSITSYTSVVASPKMRDIKIDKIQLVPVDNIGILILLICNNGVVKNSIVKSSLNISSDDLNVVSNFLNSKISGLEIDEVINILTDNSIINIQNQNNIIKFLVPPIIEAVEDLISIDLYSEGVTNILNFPEYKDVNKAKEFISFMEDKELLLDVLMKTSTSEDLDIIIGNENIYAPIKDISIITATYKIDGKTIGKIGLLGPTRMDYLNLIKTIKVFSNNITHVMDLMING